MFDMMNQAKNAIEAYNAALRINTANIANMNVPGYKRLDISFQAVLDRLMHPGTAADTSSNLGGRNPYQWGQGVGISDIRVDFSQGTTLTTAVNTDLYINGRGLFIVSNDGGSTYQYTRAGQFTKDSNNNLVTTAGMQVYGLNSSGTLVPITGLTSSLQSYSWDAGTGELRLNGAATGFRIALTYFNNAEGLEQATGTTFKETLASGSPQTPIPPGGAAGTITSGQIEQSNVSFLTESVDSIEIQRAMSANLSSVRAISDIISQFISKLG